MTTVIHHPNPRERHARSGRLMNIETRLGRLATGRVLQLIPQSVVPDCCKEIVIGMKLCTKCVKKVPCWYLLDTCVGIVQLAYGISDSLDTPSVRVPPWRP